MSQRMNRIIIDHDKQYSVSFRYRGLMKRKICEIENSGATDLFNKRARYIIEGERIYCFQLSLPLKGIFKVDSAVKSAIADKFISIDSILYDYKIINIKKHNVIVAVYCVNGMGTIFFRDGFEKIHIKSVKTYQGIIAERMPMNLRKKNTVVLARSLNYIYVVLTRQGRIEDNYVIPLEEDADTMAGLIRAALAKIKDYGCIFNKVYIFDDIYKFNRDIINCMEAENEICLLS